MTSFNSLFTKALEADNLDILLTLPKDILDEFQQEAIAFARKYKKKFGVLPTPERVKETKFKALITNKLLSSPIDDLREQTIGGLVEIYATKSYNELEVKTINGERITANDFRRIANTIQQAQNRKYVTIQNLPTNIFSSAFGKGLPLGIPFIDEANLHFPGYYRILFAPPGSAKTYLINYVAAYQLLHFKRILVVRGEMNEEEYLARIAGICLAFNSDFALQEANTNFTFAESLDKRSEYLFKYIRENGGDIIFTENATPDVEEIRYFAETHKVDFVLIDGLYQLRSGIAGKDMEREGAITNQLRDWCKDGSMIQEFDSAGNLMLEEKYYPRIFATTQMNRVGIASAKTGAEHIGGSIKYAQDAGDVYAMKPLSPVEFKIEQVKARRSKRVSGHLFIDWDDMKFDFDGKSGLVENAILNLCDFKEKVAQDWYAAHPTIVAPEPIEEDDDDEEIAA